MQNIAGDASYWSWQFPRSFRATRLMDRTPARCAPLISGKEVWTAGCHHLFIYFLLGYSCFTMLCSFLLYSKVEFPVLYSMFLLVTYFIHIRVYMSIPISQFIPPPGCRHFNKGWWLWSSSFFSAPLSLGLQQSTALLLKTANSGIKPTSPGFLCFLMFCLEAGEWL